LNQREYFTGRRRKRSNARRFRETFLGKDFNFAPVGTGITHGDFQQSDALLPHHGHLRNVCMMF
jgi:hypothetical protein